MGNNSTVCANIYEYVILMGLIGVFVDGFVGLGFWMETVYGSYLLVLA